MALILERLKEIRKSLSFVPSVIKANVLLDALIADLEREVVVDEDREAKGAVE